jgi:isopenicillin N synthase-like dioxygenase
MGADPTPTAGAALTSVPVIDGERFLAPERAGAPPPPRVVAAVAAACTSPGFFQLVNHGADAEILARLSAEACAFFALPRAAKAAATRSVDNAAGWTDAELTKQVLDLKEVFDWLREPRPDLPPSAPENAARDALDGANRWPQGRPAFRAALAAAYEELRRCAAGLAEAAGAGLGLPPNTLAPLFAGARGFARLNYYAAGTAGATNDNNTNNGAAEPLGIQRHTDAGFLTIVLQDSVPGLEVAVDGVWRPVPPLPGALTVNVGDMAQVLSNDRYRAPLHRVAVPRAPRHSAAFFYNPAPGAVLAPLAELVDERGGRPARYRPIAWGEFRSRRYKGDVEDAGAEVQIEDYRIGGA